MATQGASIIPNATESSKPFTAIHDLHAFLDGSTSPPSQTIVTNQVTTPNPSYTFWVRQDKLLLGALVGTLSSNLVLLVSRATTTKDMWDILAQTYAKPSRGHIKQLKDQFNKITKGSRTIADYMQSLKACVDNLASLGKPIEHEDLIDRVLDGLDSTYTSVMDAVNGRDTTISFEELHEKLINKELSLQIANPPTDLPATAFAATSRYTIANLAPLGPLLRLFFPLPPTTTTLTTQPAPTVPF